MSNRLRTRIRLLGPALAVLLLFAAAPASAGTISVAWDPVTHPNLVGYRVYYGTAAGSYGTPLDVGLTTQATLSGLTDCTNYYVAVKARASDGSESAVFSNEISGWSRPVATSFSPATVMRGQTLSVTIGGTNFQGGASLDFADPAITVNSMTVGSCGQITANITVDATATLGPSNFDVLNPGNVFGTGNGLFSVVNDTAGPVISSVQASNLGSTTATVTWTTDEAADSQVFFRVQGQSQYQSTTLDTTLVTSHSVSVTGLTPSTTYEYYVRSADGAGNASTSTPVQTWTTTANSFSYLRFEAESGNLDPSHVVATGSGAFQGEWLELAAGSPGGTPNNPSGTSEFGFYVPSAGSWQVWVRVYGPSASSDSWFEGVDGGSLQAVVATTTGTWQWIAGRSYTLGVGLHTFTLGGREALARVDRVLITDDATFQPSEQPGADVTAPAAVSGFTATPGDGLDALSWTNPSSADLARVIVRYRTDGSYPLSPVDGLPLYDAAATPGATVNQTHNGLTNGTTYHYAVFALDASGNASAPAQANATPQAPPLGQVQNLRRTDTR